MHRNKRYLNKKYSKEFWTKHYRKWLEKHTHQFDVDGLLIGICRIDYLFANLMGMDLFVYEPL